MNSPCFWIIDDDYDDLALIEHTLKSLPAKPRLELINSEGELISKLESLKKNSNEVRIPTAFICDYNLKSWNRFPNALRVAEKETEIYKGRYKPSFFVTTGHVRGDRVEPAIKEKIDESTLVDVAFSKERIQSINKSLQLFDELTEKNLIMDPITLSIVGIGNLGYQAILSANTQISSRGNRPCVEHIHVYSNYLNKPIGRSTFTTEFYRDWAEKLIGPYDSSRLTIHNSLSDLVSTNSHILLVTTGGYRHDPNFPSIENIRSRKEHDPLLLETSKSKMEELIGLLLKTNFNSIINIMTNPVGAYLLKCAQLNPEWKHKLTSSCPDQLRIEGNMLKYLVNNERESLERICGEIPHVSLIRGIRVYGDHGGEIPSIKDCYIGENKESGIPISEINQRYADPKELLKVELAIAEPSQNAGRESQLASRLLESPAHDAARIIGDFVRHISFHQRLPFSMHRYVNGEELGLECGECCLATPVKFVGESIFPDGPPLSELCPFKRQRLNQQLIYQKKLVSYHGNKLEKANLPQLALL